MSDCKISITRRVDGRYAATCATHPYNTFNNYVWGNVQDWASKHVAAAKQDSDGFPWREELPMILFMALTTLGLLALGLLAVFIS